MSIKRRQRQGTDSARFTRLFLVVAGVLLCAAVVLSVLAVTGGPRVRHLAVDSRLVTELPNQRLTITLNQPLARLQSSQVSVEPAADFSVNNSAASVSITFKQRLRYDTQYQVRVADAKAQQGNAAARTLSVSFRTADPDMYYIKRGGGYGRNDTQSDVIMRTSPLGTAERAVYGTGRIQEFAVVGRRLAVVTVQPDRTHQLLLVDTDDGSVTDVPLPGKGLVDQVQGTTDGSAYGFRFNRQQPETGNPEYKDALLVHDLESDGKPEALRGLNGDMVQAAEWQFAPDGAAAVAQLYDSSLLLIDARTAQKPVALGRYAEMSSFSVEGTKLAVRLGPEHLLLDVSNRQRQVIDLKPIIGNDRTIIPLRVKLLSNQPGVAVHSQKSVRFGGALSEHIVLQGRFRQPDVYSCPVSECVISDYRMTPNDQYLLVERGDAAKEHDGYPGPYRKLQSKTLLIDPATGRQLRTIDGVQLRL